jgi:hypothetical protein
VRYEADWGIGVLDLLAASRKKIQIAFQANDVHLALVGQCRVSKMRRNL